MKTESKKQDAPLEGQKDLTTEAQRHGEKPATVEDGRMFVAIEHLTPDPDQPRKVFDPEKLKELAESIKSQGIISDILVRRPTGDWFIDEGSTSQGKDKERKKFWRVLDRRKIKNGAYEGGPEVDQLLPTREEAEARLPRFEILDGERRWRAAQLAGLKVVPVALRQVKDVLAVQLVANQQRENLTALEEAAAYRKRVEGGMKAEDLAKELGVSRGTVFGRLVLTRLHPPVRDALITGKISTTVAGLVATVPGLELQKELLKEVTDRWNGPMPFREVKELVERKYVKQLSDAPWKLEEVFGVEFVKKTNGRPDTCQACPMRSGNMAGEFPELAQRPNVCTDTECFALKLKWKGQQQMALATKEGKAVLSEKEAKALYGVNSSGEVYDKNDERYVDLSKRCDALGWEYKNHWKAALGKEQPAPVLAMDPTGKVHELVPKEAAIAVLRKTGKLKKAQEDSPERWKIEQAKQRKKEELRRKENNAIAAALVAKAEELKDFGAEWMWNMVVEALVGLSGYYVMQPIERRRKWEKGKGGYGVVHERELAKMTLAQRVGLALEIATNRDEDSQNAAAKALKVDIKKVVAGREEERKAKDGKTNTKPAKKKGKK